MCTYMKNSIGYAVHAIIHLSLVDAANILALVPVTSFSHHIWNRALILELASRGHHVTVVTPDLEPVPVTNVTEILLEDSYEFADEAFDYEGFGDLSAWGMLSVYYEWGEKLCDHQLSSKGGRRILDYDDNKIFDLIILETVVNECFLAFVPKFGSPPVVGLSAFGNSIWISYMFGNPEPFSFSPSIFLPYTDKMNFIERTINSAFHIFTMYYRNYVYMPKIQKMVNKYFGQPVPDLLEVEKSFSLVLVNSIPGIDYAKPLLPSIIQVGGMHLGPPQKLPQDIQYFLDGAEKGAILFSLGSNIRSDNLRGELKRAILETFAQLSQKVLWKYESESLVDVPENVKISKWLPQGDVLAHPNLKLFISHCGLLSTQEAMYRGIPVIGIPFFEDQYINIGKIIRFGGGESLNHKMLSKESLLQAINKVLHNQSYQYNMKKVSDIFRDQPISPLQSAVYWTEYVLRHKGGPNLRSAAADIPWYKYFLIDVIVAILLSLFVTICTIIYTCLLKGKVKLH